MEPRFPLGKTVATPGAMALGIDLASYMHRHNCGDWGDLDEWDKQANEEALERRHPDPELLPGRRRPAHLHHHGKLIGRALHPPARGILSSDEKLMGS